MNVHSLLSKTKIFKMLSVIIAFSFFCNSVLYSADIIRPSTYLFNKPNLTLETDKISDLFIPETFGSIVKKYNTEKNENNKLIIHIQDAHCNYEAQHNISKILEILVRDYKVDLVAVEGATGDIDLKRFGKLEDSKVKEEVTDVFVKKGIITGPEYLKISKYNELPFGIYGIENGELYVKNFLSFRNTISNKQDTQFFIVELSKVISRLKEKVYSKELLELDNNIQLYNNNKTSLTDYAKYLSKIKNISREKYPNINTVLRSIKIEGEIDFKGVEREREQLIRHIEKDLPKEELENLVKNSLQYKLGKISTLNYYSYLEKYITNDEIFNLRRYIHLVKLQSKIDSDYLFKEIYSLEKEIKNRLFKSKIESQTDDLSEKVCTLNKLFNLQLTRETLQYFKSHKAEFSTDSLLSLIKIQAPLNNVLLHPIFNDSDFLKRIDECIVPGDRFYEEAVLRDNALVENTLKKMENENKNTAVMITGGFHTEGITRILKEKNVPHIVIVPKITKVQEDCPYLSLMTDERIKAQGSDTKKQNVAFVEMLGEGNEHIATIIKPLGISDWRRILQDEYIQQYIRGEVREIPEEKRVALGLSGKDIEMIKNIRAEIEKAGNAVTAIKVLDMIIKVSTSTSVEESPFDKGEVPAAVGGIVHEEIQEQDAEFRQSLKTQGVDLDENKNIYLGPIQEVTVAAAPRPNYLPLFIDVSPDFKKINYYEIPEGMSIDEFIEKVDREGLQPFTAYEVTEEQYLVTPTLLGAEYLKSKALGADRDKIDAMLDPKGNYGKRYVRYGANGQKEKIITSWDINVDKDVWSTMIDTVYLHNVLFESGILDNSSIQSVLEIATGGGHLSAALAQSLQGLTDLYYTDVSPYALRSAKLHIDKNMPKGKTIKQHALLGPGFKAVQGPASTNGKFDLVVCNPPYIPIPPFEKQDTADPYRGTKLVEELLEYASLKLNDQNPDAQIIMHVSSLTEVDLLGYIAKHGDRFFIEPIGQPMRVPLKINIAKVTAAWKEWFVASGLIAKNENYQARRMEPFSHIMLTYRIRLKASQVKSGEQENKKAIVRERLRNLNPNIKAQINDDSIIEALKQAFGDNYEQSKEYKDFIDNFSGKGVLNYQVWHSYLPQDLSLAEQIKLLAVSIRLIQNQKDKVTGKAVSINFRNLIKKLKNPATLGEVKKILQENNVDRIIQLVESGDKTASVLNYEFSQKDQTLIFIEMKDKLKAAILPVVREIKGETAVVPLSSEFGSAAETWLDERAHKTITTLEFEEQYQEVVAPLAAIKVEGDPAKWNEATFKAFVSYVNKYKYAKEKPALASILDELAPSGSNVNRKTLELLIRRDQFITRVAEQNLPTLDPVERQEYVTAIHNKGYFAGQERRTRNMDPLTGVKKPDLLLKVGKFGGFNENVEQDMLACLTDEAREKYLTRHNKPGKSSLIKLSLADFRDAESGIRFFELYNSSVSDDYKKDLDGIYGKDVLGEESTLREFLKKKSGESDEQYKKRLSNVNIFNGFVQSWADLINEAHSFYAGEDLKKQLDFLYGKQETALASAVALLSTPSLVEKKFELDSQRRLVGPNAGNQAFYDAVNQATHADWVVTNPWEGWQSPLIHGAYHANKERGGIGLDQMRKDEPIWTETLQIKKTRELLGLTDRDFEMFFGDLIKVMRDIFKAETWNEEKFKLMQPYIQSFLSRLKRDAALVNDAVKSHLSIVVHNAYYSGEQARVKRTRDKDGKIDPFIGGKLTEKQEEMLVGVERVNGKLVVNADAPDEIKQYFRVKAHENGQLVHGDKPAEFKGEKVKLSLKHVKRDKRVEFFRESGKDITTEEIAGLDEGSNIFNNVVRTWEELITAANKYPDPAMVKAQKALLMKMQEDAVVNIIALFKIKSLMNLSDSGMRMFIYIMNRATNALWKETYWAGWKENLVRKAFEVLESEESVEHQIEKDQRIWRTILPLYEQGLEDNIERLVRDAGPSDDVMGRISTINVNETNLEDVIRKLHDWRKDRTLYPIRTENASFKINLKNKQGKTIVLELEAVSGASQVVPQFVGETGVLYRVKSVAGDIDSAKYEAGALFKLPKGAYYSINEDGSLKLDIHSPIRLDRTRQRLTDYEKMGEYYGFRVTDYEYLYTEDGTMIGMLKPFIERPSAIVLMEQGRFTEGHAKTIVDLYIKGVSEVKEEKGRKYGAMFELAPDSFVRGDDGNLISLDADISFFYQTERQRFQYGFFTGGYGSVVNWILGSNTPLTRAEIERVWRGHGLTNNQKQIRDLFVKALVKRLDPAHPDYGHMPEDVRKSLEEELNYVLGLIATGNETGAVETFREILLPKVQKSLHPEDTAYELTDEAKRQKAFEDLFNKAHDSRDGLDQLWGSNRFKGKAQLMFDDLDSTQLAMIFLAYRTLEDFEAMQEFYERAQEAVNTGDLKKGDFVNAANIREFYTVSLNKQVEAFLKLLKNFMKNPTDDLMQKIIIEREDKFRSIVKIREFIEKLIEQGYGNGELYGALGKVWKNTSNIVGMLKQIFEQSEESRNTTVYDTLKLGFSILFPEEKGEVTIDSLSRALDKSLKEQLQAYEEGFLINFEFYPGINAVYALISMNRHEEAEELADLVYFAAELAGGKDSGDEWCLATMLQLAVIREHSEQLEDNPAVQEMIRRVEDYYNGTGKMDIYAKDALQNLSSRRGGMDKLLDYVISELKRIESTKPRMAGVEKKMDSLHERIFTYQGFNNRSSTFYIGGNFRYGGQLHDHTVTRVDIDLTQDWLKEDSFSRMTSLQEAISKIITNLSVSIAEEKDIDKKKEYELLIKGYQRLLNRITMVLPRLSEYKGKSFNDISDFTLLNELFDIDLRFTFGTQRLENLHSLSHTLFDIDIKALAEVSGARASGDSKTNLMADYFLGIGDCRQHAYTKQLFFDVWKSSRMIALMAEAYEAGKRGEDTTKIKEQIKKVKNTQMFVLDTMVRAQISVPSLYEPERGSDGKYVYSEEVNDVEGHSLNGVAELDDEGNVVRFYLADAFYQGQGEEQQEYKWGYHEAITTDELKRTIINPVTGEVMPNPAFRVKPVTQADLLKIIGAPNYLMADFKNIPVLVAELNKSENEMILKNLPEKLRKKIINNNVEQITAEELAKGFGVLLNIPELFTGIENDLRLKKNDEAMKMLKSLGWLRTKQLDKMGPFERQNLPILNRTILDVLFTGVIDKRGEGLFGGFAEVTTRDGRKTSAKVYLRADWYAGDRDQPNKGEHGQFLLRGVKEKVPVVKSQLENRDNLDRFRQVLIDYWELQSARKAIYTNLGQLTGELMVLIRQRYGTADSLLPLIAKIIIKINEKFKNISMQSRFDLLKTAIEQTGDLKEILTVFLEDFDAITASTGAGEEARLTGTEVSFAKVPGPSKSVIDEGTMEYFLREKLRQISGNLAFKSDDFIGTGTKISGLSPEVLEKLYEIAKYHHSGQARKDAANTDYMAHILGVVAIYVNILGITDINAIVAAFLHDTLEDSVEYYNLYIASLPDVTERERFLRLSPQEKRKSLKDKVKGVIRALKPQVRDKIKSALPAIPGVNLDSVFEYVEAMSKEEGIDLVRDYFPNLIQKGTYAVALKLADRIYYLRDLKHSDQETFAEGYIFGRSQEDPGTIVEYIEADMGNGKSFLNSLPGNMANIRVMFTVTLLQSIMDNYSLKRIKKIQKIEDAKAVVRRIVGEIAFPAAGIDTIEEVLQYTISALKAQQSPDMAVDEDSYESVVKDFVNMLGLDYAEVAELINMDEADNAELVHKLIGLMKAEGKEVSEEDVRVVVENAEKVDRILTGLKEKLEAKGKILPKNLETAGDRIAVYLAIKELSRERELPGFLKVLSEGLKAKQIVNDEMVDKVTEDIFRTDAFYIEDGRIYRSRFYDLYLQEVKEKFGIKKGDDNDKLLEKLVEYKFKQIYVQNALKTARVETGNVKEVLESAIDRNFQKIIGEMKLVNLSARFMVEEEYLLNSITDQARREKIRKNIKDYLGKKGLANINWQEELGKVLQEDIDRIGTINGLSGVLDVDSPVVERLGRQQILFEKAEDGEKILSALSGYKRQQEQFERNLSGILPSLDETADKLTNRVYLQDVSSYIGEVEDKGQGRYAIQDSGAVGVEMIRMLQKKGIEQVFAYKIEEEIEAFKGYLVMHGIQYGPEHQITFINKNEKTYLKIKGETEARNKILVSMGNERSKSYFTGEGLKDRIVIGDDLMLLTRAALVVGTLDNLNTTTLETAFAPVMKTILKEYYRGSRSDDDISNDIRKMITEGIWFILPPITPFIKTYYNALKESRELVLKAA